MPRPIIVPRVILIGGEPSTRRTMHALLRRLGCQVVQGGPMTELVADPAVTEAHLLVVLVTVTEPADQCLAPLMRLRAAGNDLPTVLVARGPRMDLRERAFALGVLDVVSLPAATADLQARLSAALDTQVPEQPDGTLTAATL